MVAGRAVTPSEISGGERLKLYWAQGEGRAKWIGSPHPYTTLITLLREHVSENIVHGLAANIFFLATGHYPGQRKDGERL